MEQYGNGPSTGLEQGAIDAPATGFTPADLDVAEDERRVLRELAGRVARIAAGPGMKETRRLWREHNMLRPARPVVFCDPENGWNEIITESQMRCRGKIARRWEMSLRKEIFWGEEMGDDKPIDPRWHVVKNHPRLRRVSCSPWADLEKMAQNLQDRYILSLKPNPSTLSETARRTWCSGAASPGQRRTGSTEGIPQGSWRPGAAAAASIAGSGGARHPPDGEGLLLAAQVMVVAVPDRRLQHGPVVSRLYPGMDGVRRGDDVSPAGSGFQDGAANRFVHLPGG